MNGRLTDRHGREIKDLRVSVTDRCNFRCQYCMPAEGLPWLERDEILTYEEIARLVAVFADMGVSKVRVTGGEPLVRKDLYRMIALLKAFKGIEDIAITTNGFLLKEQVAALVDAGLGRINVSLDSLSHDRFFQLTRRDALNRVLQGIEAAGRYPQLRPLKINVVAIKGFTEDEVVAFAKLAREMSYTVRFIEYMPLDAGGEWQPGKVLPNAVVRSMIESRFDLVPLERERGSTSSVYRFADSGGQIGFVSPVSEPFCSECNRVRLTADGRLRTCLFSHSETDLKSPLRAGATDAELEQIVRAAVFHKELRHRIGEGDFTQPQRPMSRIGG